MIKAVFDKFYSIVNTHNLKGVEQAVYRELVTLSASCKEVHPSNYWLSQKVNCSVRAIQYSINNLVKKGLIVKKARYDRSHKGKIEQKTNSYIVCNDFSGGMKKLHTNKKDNNTNNKLSSSKVIKTRTIYQWLIKKDKNLDQMFSLIEEFGYEADVLDEFVIHWKENRGNDFRLSMQQWLYQLKGWLDRRGTFLFHA